MLPSLQLRLQRDPPQRKLPVRGVPAARPDRVLPAVLRGDGADAEDGRHPGPGRVRIQPRNVKGSGDLRRAATSTPTPGSRCTSTTSAGCRSTRRRRRLRRNRRAAGSGCCASRPPSSATGTYRRPLRPTAPPSSMGPLRRARPQGVPAWVLLAGLGLLGGAVLGSAAVAVAVRSARFRSTASCGRGGGSASRARSRRGPATRLERARHDPAGTRAPSGQRGRPGGRGLRGQASRRPVRTAKTRRPDRTRAPRDAPRADRGPGPSGSAAGVPSPSRRVGPRASAAPADATFGAGRRPSGARFVDNRRRGSMFFRQVIHEDLALRVLSGRGRPRGRRRRHRS